MFLQEPVKWHIVAPNRFPGTSWDPGGRRTSVESTFPRSVFPGSLASALPRSGSGLLVFVASPGKNAKLRWAGLAGCLAGWLTG